VSREFTRHTVGFATDYDAILAGYLVRMARHRLHRRPKLNPDGKLFELVAYLLRKYLSSQRIARTLKSMFLDDTQH
jgi:IS30 family transposase